MEIDPAQPFTDHALTGVRTASVGAFTTEGFPEGPFEVSTRGNGLRIDGLHFDPGSGRVLTLVVDRGPHRLIGQVYDAYDGLGDGGHVFILAAGGSTGLRRSLDIGRGPVDLNLYLQ